MADDATLIYVKKIPENILRSLENAGVNPAIDGDKETLSYDEINAANTKLQNACDLFVNTAKLQREFHTALEDLIIFVYKNKSENICAQGTNKANAKSLLLSDALSGLEHGDMFLRLNIITGEECLKKHGIKLYLSRKFVSFMEYTESLGLKFEDAKDNKIKAIVGNQEIIIDLEHPDYKSFNLSTIELVAPKQGDINIVATYSNRWENRWPSESYPLKGKKLPSI